MRPDAPHFTLSNAGNFTCQGESAATQWVNEPTVSC
jgi:hypothetical protein